MRNRFFLIIIFLFTICLRAYSQQQYRFSHLDINQGLSNNQINDFLRDRRGFLWVATASGLNRFDGYTFKVFKSNELDSSSLPNNTVNKLFEDPNGKIWVVTALGLCIYDPLYEKFERNIDAVLKAFSLPKSNINDVKKDQFGRYWFLYSQGLYRYTPDKKKTVFVNPFPDIVISSFVENADGDIWIIYRNGMFVKLDRNTLQAVYVNRALCAVPHNERYHVKIDLDGDLWIYANSVNNGIYHFREEDKSIRHIDKNTPGMRLNNDIVRDLEVADNGLVWVATDHGGLNIIDKKSGIVTYCTHDPNDKRSVSQNSVSILYKDRENVMWAGTFKQGVSYYHPDMNKFGLYQHNPFQSNSLPYSDINRFSEDKTGNIWIGSNGGGLIYFNRKQRTFTQYVSKPGASGMLSSDVLVSLSPDHKDKLWIGTYFGGLNYFDGSQFTHFRHDPSNPNSISDNNIWDLMEDSQHNLWIGMLNHGLDRYDPVTKIFSHYQQEQGIYSGYVTSILEDKAGNIWVGTGYGLSVRWKGKDIFEHILASAKPGGMTSNSILSLRQDSHGMIWVGTQDGLNVYDVAKNMFAAFGEKDGLPDNTILGIVEDDYKKMWLATSKGISCASVISRQNGLKLRFVNYDETDGLQGMQYNKGAAYKTSNGELFFGGVNGFNVINPAQIRINKNKPALALVDLKINNGSVVPGQESDGKVMLEKSITETSEITLGPDDNSISITFAALSYFHPLKNKYRYILEGFNQDWVETSGTLRHYY